MVKDSVVMVLDCGGGTVDITGEFVRAFNEKVT
jgi:hypothetical protein